MSDADFKYNTKDFTGGINVSLDPTKIKDNEFTKFENLIVYKLGSLGNAVKRKGFDRYDAYTVSGDSILSLYEYITNAKTSNVQKIIAKTPTTLEAKDLTGAFSTLLSDDATKKCSFLTYKDNLYIFNRKNTALLGNKVYNTTEMLDQGCPPCPQNFSLTAITGTATYTAEWRYLITYVYDNKQESYFIPYNNYVDSSAPVYPEVQSTYQSPSYSAGVKLHFGYRYISITTKDGVLLDNIPTGNSRVTARKIYRTKNQGKTLYYLDTIADNTTTKYYDYTPDADLITEADLSFQLRPYKSRYAIIHKERMFMGNVEENQFSTLPSVVALTNTEVPIVSGVGLSYITGGHANSRSAVYTWKFAYLYAGMQSIWTDKIGAPYVGFIGAKTSGSSFTLTAGQKMMMQLNNIGNTDLYSRKVCVFRNACQFVNGVTIGSSTVTVDYTSSATVGQVFKVGDSVTLDGITGITGINRTVTVTAATANSITFAKSGETGTWTTDTGIIKGNDYYFIGVTSTDGTVFVDNTQDDYLVNQVTDAGDVKVLGGITQLSADTKYPSLLKWSEIESPDVYVGTKESPINQGDNDQIRAIAEGRQGVLIWKDKNMYILYTTSGDETLWNVQQVYQNVGCSDTDTISSFVKLPNNEFMWRYNNEFYMWQEGSFPHKASEKIQTILDSLTFLNLDVAYDWKRNWVIYAYTTSAVNGGVLICDLNFRDERGNGTWYHFVSNDSANALQVHLYSPFVLKDGTMIFGYDATGAKVIMKYGSNDYDKFYNNDTGVWDNTRINVKLGLKSFNNGTTDYKHLRAKITCSSVPNPAETFSVFKYKDGASSPTQVTTKNIDGTKFRLNANFNEQYYKEGIFLIANDSNINFEIQEIQLEGETRHTEVF